MGGVAIVSIDAAGAPVPDAQGQFIAADADAVVFTAADIFSVGRIQVRRNGLTAVASVLPDGSIVSATALGISPDGGKVLFSVTDEETLDDREARVYLRDLDSLQSTLVRTIPDPVVAAPGTARPSLFVVASDDISTLFIQYGPPTAWTVTRVDLDAGTEQQSELIFYNQPSPYSRLYSADGVFSAWNSNWDEESFVFSGDVYRHDFTTGADVLLTIGYDGSPANGPSIAEAISGDGDRIFFVSEASNLVVGDTNGTIDLFMADVTTGEIERLAVPVVELGWGLADFGTPELTVDHAGNRLAITAADQISLYDLPSATWFPSLPTEDGLPPNGPVTSEDFNRSGTELLFTSPAENLVDVSIPRSGAFLLSLDQIPFDDISLSIFAGEILWLRDQGITRGCSPDGRLFCPDDFVTRGQMAAFLNRALALPGAEADTFVDDDGSIFEGDIEALFAAGITRGCTPDGSSFCPDDFVTRGQMAAFLNRALALPGAEADTFVDDDGSIFEGDIEALFAAGITRGCTPDGSSFCPDDFVTRGQMAAFLFRALNG